MISRTTHPNYTPEAKARREAARQATIRMERARLIMAASVAASHPGHSDARTQGSRR